MSQAKRMAKHSSIYAIGNISRQLVGFIMLPVYTRYLSPADYGVVGLLIFLVSIIELVFGGHLSNAVPKFYHDQNDESGRKSVISTALLVTTVVSAFTVSMVVMLRDQASFAMFGTVEYAYVVGMFAVLILTHALENYALIYIRLQKRPWFFVAVNMGKLIVQLSLNVWLVVFLELGVEGVAISTMTSSVLFAGGMAIYTLWKTGLNVDARVGKLMVSFCWPLWIGGMAGLYTGSANRYFIRVFGSLEEVGLFELAVRFGAIISLLIWMPFAQYWQIERFEIYKQENPIPIYQSVFRFVCFLMVAVGLGVSLFAEIVIRIMASNQFLAASSAVPFIVFGVIFSCLTVFCNFSFLVKEKTGWMGRNSYITAAIITVFYLFLIPRFGYVGAALALMLAHSAQFLITFFSAKKHYDMQLPLSPLGFCLMISLVAVTIDVNLESGEMLVDIAIKLAILSVSCILMAGYLFVNKEMRQYVAKLLWRN